MNIVVTDVNDNDPEFNLTITTNFTVEEEKTNLFVGQVMVSDIFSVLFFSHVYYLLFSRLFYSHMLLFLINCADH